MRRLEEMGMRDLNDILSLFAGLSGFSNGIKVGEVS